MILDDLRMEMGLESFGTGASKDSNTGNGGEKLEPGDGYFSNFEIEILLLHSQKIMS